MNTDVSSFGFYIQNDLRCRLLEFYHRKETSEEYSYRGYMRAIVVFRSEHEFKSFLNYVQTHMGEYHEIYQRRGNTDLPHFPNLSGYDMEHFKKDYKNALVMCDMLNEFRATGQTMIAEESTHANT